MPPPKSPEFQRAWEELVRTGLLLESDARLPSVAALVAGEPIRGSWWGHAQGKAIFATSSALGEHRDVVVTRLVSRKVTFVHRKLWPALLAVARSGEMWQVGGLTLPVKAVLSAVRRAGILPAEDLPGSSMLRRKALKEIEARLLVHSDEVHTESGAHSKVLETWDHWAVRARAPQKRLSAERARAKLDAVMAELNARHGATASLPWHARGA